MATAYPIDPLSFRIPLIWHTTRVSACHLRRLRAEPTALEHYQYTIFHCWRATVWDIDRLIHLIPDVHIPCTCPQIWQVETTVTFQTRPVLLEVEMLQETTTPRTYWLRPTVEHQ